MEVVDVDRASRPRGCRARRSRRRRCRPSRRRRPATSVNAQLWCSRPVVVGGVVERRAAELGRPDDQRVVEHAALLQVVEQAGDRLVDVACASGPWSSMSPCESQLFDEPVSISSTNRTPRSASRRATRHCQPKPVVSARASGRRARASRRSPSTGRTPRAPRVCMPKAVSNDWIRAASAGSSARVARGAGG